MGTTRTGDSDRLECPFCGFKNEQYYALALHIESFHTEGSPFIAEDEAASHISEEADDSDDEYNTYILCPEEDCGETMLLVELQNHMDMHGAERIAMNDLGETSTPRPSTSSSQAPVKLKRSRSGKSRKGHRSSDKSKSKSSGSSSSKSRSSGSSRGRRRSAKSELGPYAAEKQMPAKLYEQLIEGPQVMYQNRIGPNGALVRTTSVANETPYLIPLIGKLLERDPSVARAWLCDSAVRHICKQLPREGGFCGYRNIQMLVTYVQTRYPRGTHPFTEFVPTIIKIQHDIEHGWEKGINSNGRVETGGILGTRKYIGTSEAETFFKVQGIPCIPHCIIGTPDMEAHNLLFEFVERYFEVVRPSGVTDRVLRTSQPPLYFQHAGHSMTIIGLEKHVDGYTNILVFDPTFSISPAMKDLIWASKIKSKVNSEGLLKAHRRGQPYLGKYKEFELLSLR